MSRLSVEARRCCCRAPRTGWNASPGTSPRIPRKPGAWPSCGPRRRSTCCWEVPGWERIAGHVHVLLPSDVLTRDGRLRFGRLRPAHDLLPICQRGHCQPRYQSNRTARNPAGTANARASRDASCDGIRAGKRARVRNRRASARCGHRGGQDGQLRHHLRPAPNGHAGPQRPFGPHDPSREGPAGPTGCNGRTVGRGTGHRVRGAVGIRADRSGVGVPHRGIGRRPGPGCSLPRTEPRWSGWSTAATARRPTSGGPSGCATPRAGSPGATARPRPANPTTCRNGTTAAPPRLENLASLCKRHHTLKTLGLWAWPRTGTADSASRPRPATSTPPAPTCHGPPRASGCLPCSTPPATRLDAPVPVRAGLEGLRGPARRLPGRLPGGPVPAPGCARRRRTTLLSGTGTSER